MAIWLTAVIRKTVTGSAPSPRTISALWFLSVLRRLGLRLRFAPA